MLSLFNKEEILQLTKTVTNEKKIGETIYTVNEDNDFFEEVENCPATFVLIGIPEDIFMRGNIEKSGADNALFPSIEALVNSQENQFFSGKDILALGYLDYTETSDSFITDDAEKGHYLVKQLDKDVSELIHFLVSVGKSPIVIGGGQNNAYGILKGMATAKEQKVNAINLDNKPDLYETDLRNNTNAFSYAIKDGFLDQYFIFGLNENETPQSIFDTIQSQISIEYTMYEEIAVYETTTFNNELQRAKQFINSSCYGIEVDLDSLQNFNNNNTMIPKGLTPQQARHFVYYLAKHKNASYLHLSDSITNRETVNIAGKFISNLIIDFIKAKKWVD